MALVAVLAAFVVLCASSQAMADLLLRNTATAAYTDGRGNVYPVASAWVESYITPTKAIYVEVSALPESAYPGSLVKYVVKVSNPGMVDLDDVELSIALPLSTVQYVGATGQGAYSSGQVIWPLGTMTPGDEQTLELLVRIDSALAGEQTIALPFKAKTSTGPEAAATATATILERTQGVVSFIDENGSEKTSYRSGERVCVRVSDADQNKDGQTADSVKVIVDDMLSMGGEQSIGDSIEITLVETSRDSGVFEGCVDSDSGPASPGDGIIFLATDTLLRATYSDPLDSMASVTTSALVDPLGVVFDSITGTPVSGATVTLLDVSTGGEAILPQPPEVDRIQENPVVTGANGKFQFEFVRPGNYRLEVRPPPGSGYRYPTVLSDDRLPSGFQIGTGSRNEVFTLVKGMSPLNLDIPLDPAPAGLELTKTADRESAEIGDFIRYTITVSNNNSNVPAEGLKVTDRLPKGFAIVKGSSSVEGVKVEHPLQTGEREFTYHLGAIGAGKTIRLTYKALAGPSSMEGDGRNTAVASAVSLGENIRSNAASVKVKITRGVFTYNGTIIGRVIPATEGGGKPPPVDLSSIAIYLEDGTRVSTDASGKYSIEGVREGSHTVRIDEKTIPGGYRPGLGNFSSLGSDLSQLVIMPRAGIRRVDFTILTADTSMAAKTAQPADQGTTIPETAKPPQVQWEREIAKMDSSFAILEPREGSETPSSSKIVVKGMAGESYALKINGVPVEEARIGKRTTYGQTFLVEYFGVRLAIGDENTITMEDMKGNVRARAKVYTAGLPAKLETKTSPAEPEADGKTPVGITVRVLDKRGGPAAVAGTVTVADSDFDILSEDVDPNTPGLQLALEKNAATLQVRSPVIPGNKTAILKVSGLEERIDVQFIPEKRTFLVVGLGEATLGHGKRNKNNSTGTEGLYTDGRGAFFAKGEVTEGVTLTAAYDSDKERKELFASRLTIPEAEKYPVLGDESRTVSEATSTDNLFLRLDTKNSSLLYGDFSTGIGKNSVYAYDRSFTGFKAGSQGRNWNFTGFIAETDQSLVVDEIQGKGTSGYYKLSREVLAGSEKIRIEVRDSLRTDNVLSKKPLERGLDYKIDYDLGDILLNEPLASHDASMNPVYLVAVYETKGGGRDFTVVGGRVAYRPVENLTIGLSAANEEKDVRDYRLIGVDLGAELPAGTNVRIEYAATDSLTITDGELIPRDGDSLSISLKSKPAENLQLEGFYKSASNHFDNPSAPDMEKGTVKHGAAAKFAYDGETDFKAGYLDEYDTIGHASHRRISAGIEKRFERVTAELAAIRETNEENSDTAQAQSPFDKNMNFRGDSTSLKASASAKITDDLSLGGSMRQDFGDEDRKIADAGLSYRVAEGQSIYLKQQYAKNGYGAEETRTVFGGESRVGKGTTLYTESRLQDGMDGERASECLGMKSDFPISGHLTGKATAEKTWAVAGTSQNGDPETLAGSLGLDYKPGKTFKSSGRVEYRRVDDDLNPSETWLYEIGAAFKTGDSTTVFIKENYFATIFDNTGSRRTSLATLGAAFRPLDESLFDLLSKFSWKRQTDSMEEESTVSNAYIGSVAMNFIPVKKCELGIKYAGKYLTENTLDAYTDLISISLSLDVTARWDVYGEYRKFTTYKPYQWTSGGALETGYRLLKNVWLSAGYSFDRFDEDLKDRSQFAEGPYIKIRVKLDHL